MIRKKEKNYLIKSVSNNLPKLNKKYKSMLTHISSNLPAIQKSSDIFYKSDSQYKMVTLNMQTLTPIRSLYHLLADIEKTKNAIQNNLFKTKESELNLKKKEKDLNKNEKNLSIEEIEQQQLKIIELKMNLKEGENYIKGAIRKLSFLSTQHKLLLKKIGKEVTEEDYELDERRHHVMTAFKQALIAARSRGGIVDEGNMIYFFDLGINGHVAQQEVTKILNEELKEIQKGKEPSHEMLLKWLKECADKYEKNAIEFARQRGFDVLDFKSLHSKNGKKTNNI
jgi:hypothetical protein